MQIAEGKKIFFLSDFHLGTPDRQTSLQREKYIIRFLESIQHEASEIFILGDLFDFWFDTGQLFQKVMCAFWVSWQHLLTPEFQSGFLSATMTCG